MNSFQVNLNRATRIMRERQQSCTAGRHPPICNAIASASTTPTYDRSGSHVKARPIPSIDHFRSRSYYIGSMRSGWRQLATDYRDTQVKQLLGVRSAW